MSHTIARICVDVHPLHLDRLFDYHIPEALQSTLAPGMRVRVPFGGQIRTGIVCECTSTTTFTGTLADVQRLISTERVLTDEILTLSRTIADRYVGSLADVLRLAIPPRHATTEKKPTPDPPPAPSVPNLEAWNTYTHGTHLLDALTRGASPRAVWQIHPHDDWTQRISEILTTATATGRGSICIVPDERAITQLEKTLNAYMKRSQFVTLTASSGPASRYRRFLALSRGNIQCVIGTRAASFAPVKNLGCLIILDDIDTSHAEPRAPYPHARETLLIRAEQTGAAMILASHTRTPEAQLLLDTEWAHPVTAPRSTVHNNLPHIRTLPENLDTIERNTPIGTTAHRTIETALTNNTPVLIHIPRRGYATATLCTHCRQSARCTACNGPIQLITAHTAQCRWCDTTATTWSCRNCHNTTLRSATIGIERLREDLGRSFPHTRLYTSTGDTPLETVPQHAALVLSTPGVEPLTEKRYGAALLLSPMSLLALPHLRAATEALHHWMRAAELVKDAHSGGRVLIAADSNTPVVRAFAQWDPAKFAAHELAERAELHFPPATRIARIMADHTLLTEFLSIFTPPPTAEILGPIEEEQPSSAETSTAHSVIVRAPRRETRHLVRALREAAIMLRTRVPKTPLKVSIDPIDL